MAPLHIPLRFRSAAAPRIVLYKGLISSRHGALRLASSSAQSYDTAAAQQRQPEKPEKETQQSEQALVQRAIISDDSQMQKTLAATKAYIEKLQADVRPRLQAYLQRLNQASQQLRSITADVNDSKEALRRASGMLNELTGYNEIDALKKRVTQQATVFEHTRDQVQEAKTAYEAAIDTRSATQRGINELLQRKHLWTDDDVTKFTELYRLEHAHSLAEAAAKEKYQATEKQMDREYMELARSIMERYHEEQLWSDKIRSVSTYGTWALMVVNLLLFVAVQTVFEPRKRQKLTDRFEELLVAKVNEEESKFQTLLEEKDKQFAQQQALLLSTLNQLTEHPLFEEKDLLQSILKQATVPAPLSIPSIETDDNIPAAATAPIPTTTRTIDDTAEAIATSMFIEDKALPEYLDPAPFSEGAELNETPHSTMEATDQIIEHDSPGTLTLSKNKLMLYTIESAVAGGLITAACAYFFK